MYPWYRTKAALAAAAEGGLIARTGSNPFGSGGATKDELTSCVDEPDIEAEGVEVALVCAERVAALLAANAGKGATPGIKVGRLADWQGFKHCSKPDEAGRQESASLCATLTCRQRVPVRLRSSLPVQ